VTEDIYGRLVTEGDDDDMKALTGINPEYYRQMVQELMTSDSKGKRRVDVENRALMVSMHHHLGLTQQLIAEIFTISHRSTVGRHIKKAISEMQKTSTGMNIWQEYRRRSETSSKPIGTVSEMEDEHGRMKWLTSSLLDSVKNNARRNPGPRVEALSLTPMQHKVLTKIVNEETDKIAPRADAIIRIANGESHSAIARAIGKDRRFVQRWAERWSDKARSLGQVSDKDMERSIIYLLTDEPSSRQPGLNTVTYSGIPLDMPELYYIEMAEQAERVQEYDEAVKAGEIDPHEIGA
jgi:hypothetical protein